MTPLSEPLPAVRQDLQHQHASDPGLAKDRDAAERHAWDALGRYKFVRKATPMRQPTGARTIDGPTASPGPYLDLELALGDVLGERL